MLLRTVVLLLTIVPLEAGDEASAALDAASDALASGRFGEAAALLAAAEEATSAEAVVAAAEGLWRCGDVVRSAAAFEQTEALLPETERTEAERALATRAAVGRAEAIAHDSTRTAAEQAAAIEAAALADPAPPLAWSLWAAEVLQLQLARTKQPSGGAPLTRQAAELAAVTLLERAVMHNATAPLPLDNPAFAAKLRLLLQRRMNEWKGVRGFDPGAAAELNARLMKEHKSYRQQLPPAGEKAGAPSRVSAGSAGDIWRVGHPDGPGATLARHDASAPQVVTLETIGEVTLSPVASSPAAFVVDGFATAEECAALIEAGKPELVRAAPLRALRSLLVLVLVLVLVFVLVLLVLLLLLAHDHLLMARMHRFRR